MANIDKDKLLNELAKASGGKMDMEKIKKAAENEDVSSLVSALPENDKNKIMNILNDKDSLKALLKNPQVNDIINSFLGKGGK